MVQNTRREPRAKVLSMTVRYRSATLGEFIEHHSYDVSRGGMFIKTPSPFPAGTLLKFEVKIAEEQRLMQGVGRVVWKREGEQAGENAPAGMGIKFIKIDEASHAVIERLVENRGHGGPSAFEQSSPASPPKSLRMFPEHAPLATPAEGEAPPPVGLVTEGGESSSPSIVALAEEAASDSGAPSSGTGSGGAGSSGAGSSGAGSGGAGSGGAQLAKKAARRAQAGAASAAAASGGERPSGRRWFVVALVVLFVLGMIYVLTHKAPDPSVGSRSPSVIRVQLRVDASGARTFSAPSAACGETRLI
jgi:uncharacterized protein (TIGR02266 family)